MSEAETGRAKVGYIAYDPVMDGHRKLWPDESRAVALVALPSGQSVPALRADLVGALPPTSVELLHLLGRHMHFNVQQCAWCKAVYGIKADDDGGMTTHGICAPCADKERGRR